MQMFCVALLAPLAIVLLSVSFKSIGLSIQLLYTYYCVESIFLIY